VSCTLEGIVCSVFNTALVGYLYRGESSSCLHTCCQDKALAHTFACFPRDPQYQTISCIYVQCSRIRQSHINKQANVWLLLIMHECKNKTFVLPSLQHSDDNQHPQAFPTAWNSFTGGWCSPGTVLCVTQHGRLANGSLTLERSSRNKRRDCGDHL